VHGALRPVALMTASAEEWGAHDLEQRFGLGPARDELTALAATLDGLLGRIAASRRHEQHFAADVAHELRTPLAGIRALADYGLSQSDPRSWREQLERIASSQARASRLVDQLLDLALAHEAEAGLKMELVALDALVRDALLRFLPRADAAGVDLGAVGIDSSCTVRADATLVDGILTNLLDNALRYGASADGPSTVTVVIDRPPGEVVLMVQDNGAGLPGELQDQLVHRGAQGQLGQLLGQGAGLGLALVSQYATLMDARMVLGSGAGGRGWVCAIHFATAAAA
jgi:two-component system sensor histidine kinase TctE